jgi:hypothetical protein
VSRPLRVAPTQQEAGAPLSRWSSRRRRTPPRSWLAAVALWASLSVLAGVWGLALPLMASPDEQSHVVKAAAVVRGELHGYEDPDRDPSIAPGRPTLVQLPQPYRFLDTLPSCHAFRDHVTADCTPVLAGDPEVTDRAPTFAGRYPPLYYAMVGWPSRLSSGVPALYGMRALSGALAAVPLTAGLLFLLGTAVPRLALLGAGAAITPMALSLFGVVNPNGLEIACAFCAWSALLVAVLAPDPARLRRRVLTATAALAVMVNLRASAPLFGLLLVATVLAVAPWPVLREVLRARVTWVAAAVGVVTGSASAAWVLGVGTLQGPVGRYPELAETSFAAREAAGRSVEYLRQMVGVFGWLDAPAPALTFLAWGAAITVLVVLAVAGCSRRGGLVVGALVVALVALPIGVQLPGAADAGLIWQGRYLLPLAAGLPLLSALLLARDQPALVRSLRLEAVLVPLLVVGHIGALHWVLRRYAVGVRGELLVLDPAWQPPLLGVWPLLVLYTAGLVVAVLLLRALSARPPARPPVPGHEGPPA